MLYEILTTGSMGAVVLSTFYLKSKGSANDHEKIKTIADANGLKVGSNSIRIKRKYKSSDYVEYVYQMPLGLSFKQFKDNKRAFIDGLNNKSKIDVHLSDFKKIDWRKNVVDQIRRILTNRKKLDKHLEIDYDGMLKFRVYDNGLQDRYTITKDIMSSCKQWNVSLGRTLKGQITHDFETGPHVLVGGSTDMGKSTILNVIINTLLHNHPNDVEFTLIDLKGGLEFGDYRDLKQVRYFAKDVMTAKKALESIQQEMSATFVLLENEGKRNVKEQGIKKRHFVIIDEAAELSSVGETDKNIKNDKQKCENYIKDIARRGRASGIRLIYSTQYPTTETIGSQVKRNLTTRLALSVDTSIASSVVLDEKGAEELGFVQGRAIYKRTKKEVMQSYYIKDSLINEIKAPHINIRSKKEDADVKRARRKDSFTLKEI